MELVSLQFSELEQYNGSNIRLSFASAKRLQTELNKLFPVEGGHVSAPPLPQLPRESSPKTRDFLKWVYDRMLLEGTTLNKESYGYMIRFAAIIEAFDPLAKDIQGGTIGRTN